MKVRELTQPITLRAIVEGWQKHTITRNGEYQRARRWKRAQQQLLVDSVLRGYPLPRFYFSVDEAPGPLGDRVASLQIIDGLQRIVALSDFVADSWPLLSPTKAPGRFPRSVAAAPCPWAGLRYSDLSSDLRDRLLSEAMPVVIIESFDSTDELRDLFIRLQAGTALTRQQVRDAWPGAMSPYITAVAGKENRQGRFPFLSRLDGRSARRNDDVDELEDAYHEGRQTAAQLLCLFLAWRRGEGVSSVGASALDGLYHTETDFDSRGPLATDFERVVGYAERIVQHHAPYTTAGTRWKVSKLQLLTVFLSLARLDAAPLMRLDRELPSLAKAFWAAAWPSASDPAFRAGKTTSWPTIQARLEWFEEAVVAKAGLTWLDARRRFSAEEQEELLRRAADACGICGRELLRSDAEFDHVTPWILGGPTSLDNGRAVHGPCNRQRPNPAWAEPGEAQAA